MWSAQVKISCLSTLTLLFLFTVCFFKSSHFLKFILLLCKSVELFLFFLSHNQELLKCDLQGRKIGNFTYSHGWQRADSFVVL